MQECSIGKLGKQEGKRSRVKYKREKERLGKKEVVHNNLQAQIII